MNNSSIIQTNPAKIFVFVGLAAVGFPSLVLNLVVIYFSACLPALKGKSYRIFLLNQAVIDLSYSLFTFGIEIAILIIPGFCSWGGALPLVGMAMLTQALVPVCINRYVAVCKRSWHKTLFSTWRMVFFIAYPYLAGIVFSVYAVSVTETVEGGTYEIGCIAINVKPSEEVIAKSFIFGGTGLAYTIIGYCSFRLRRKAKELEASQENLADQGKLAETRYLLKAITAQAIIPIAGQIPMMLFYSINDYSANEKSIVSQAIAILIFHLCPSLDALATLAIVKPYRQALVNLRKKIAVGLQSAQVGPVCSASTG